MRLPDFIIIGAAKSGTTTLYQYLCRHPQVYMSTPKEPEFFARDERYDRGMEWYASLFSKAQSHQVCGEASTIYTRWPQFPEAAPRISKALPTVKLIYIMRHPVERAYSHYVQRIKNAQNARRQLEVQGSFEQRIKKESFFLDSSDYMKQIEQYIQLFPKELFLFILMDDLIKNPADTIGKVCHFIGVDAGIDIVENQPIAANQATYHKEWFLRSRITAPLKKIPGLAGAAALLPQGVRDGAYQVLRQLPYRQQVEQKYLPQPMLPETRQMLLARFREPNQRLAEFLERDLSHWDK